MLQNYEKTISNTQSVVAMERCLTDLACSMKVMRSFANSDLVSDCDGDGLMNCDDFAMAIIWEKLDVKNLQKELPTKIHDCMNVTKLVKIVYLQLVKK